MVASRWKGLKLPHVWSVITKLILTCLLMLNVSSACVCWRAQHQPRQSHCDKYKFCCVNIASMTWVHVTVMHQQQNIWRSPRRNANNSILCWKFAKSTSPTKYHSQSCLISLMFWLCLKENGQWSLNLMFDNNTQLYQNWRHIFNCQKF